MDEMAALDSVMPHVSLAMLDQLLTMAKAATGLPWSCDWGDMTPFRYHSGLHYGLYADGDGGRQPGSQRHVATFWDQSGQVTDDCENAEYAVRACNLVPLLVAEIRRLQDILARSRP